MFNSPTAFCTARRTWVAIDQTRRECALEHGCGQGTNCPLQSMLARNAARQLRGTPESMRAIG
jgi:hypothetical protein